MDVLKRHSFTVAMLIIAVAIVIFLVAGVGGKLSAMSSVKKKVLQLASRINQQLAKPEQIPNQQWVQKYSVVKEAMHSCYKQLRQFYHQVLDGALESWFPELEWSREGQDNVSDFCVYYHTYMGKLAEALEKAGVQNGIPKKTESPFGEPQKTNALYRPKLYPEEEIEGLSPAQKIQWMKTLQKQYWIQERIVTAACAAKIIAIEKIQFPEKPELEVEATSQDVKPTHINRLISLPAKLGTFFQFGATLRMYYHQVPKFLSELLRYRKDKPLPIRLRSWKLDKMQVNPEEEEVAVTKEEKASFDESKYTRKKYLHPVRLIVVGEVLDFDIKADR
jgi:hypothetical protein